MSTDTRTGAGPGPGPRAGTPSVELVGLSKDFGAHRVLDQVDLAFAPGSIHALLGANGSGKSTLIKVLAGYHAPTAGTIRLHGEEIATPVTPAAVHQAGVRFVHQDLGLVGSLPVTDNLALALGWERTAGTISWRAQRAAARADLEAVGLGDLDPSTPVRELGPVQQTLVAMARAVRGLEPGRGVLVLDEPTARLPNAQVDDLLERCRVLRDQGVALVYVSHRLDEVFAMADRVTVLRDGRVVLDDAITATDPEHLTGVITGRDQGTTARADAARERAAAPGADAPVRLRLRGVSGTFVRDVDLDLRRGEVLAVTGLIGSGRSELGRLVYGVQPLTAGTVELDGEPLTGATPSSSMRRGIGYVPQDRAKAAVPGLDVTDNLTMADTTRHVRRGWLSRRSQREATTAAIAALDVRPADPDRLLRELSGGNQQKVVLGKWLELDLRLLVLDEPTYGVDVGARAGILASVLERVRTAGLSVLLLDSDIDLVADYADRVLVMRRGRVVAELGGEQITTEAIATASYAVDDPAGPARPDRSHQEEPS